MKGLLDQNESEVLFSEFLYKLFEENQCVQCERCIGKIISIRDDGYYYEIAVDDPDAKELSKKIVLIGVEKRKLKGFKDFCTRYIGQFILFSCRDEFTVHAFAAVKQDLPERNLPCIAAVRESKIIPYFTAEIEADFFAPPLKARVHMPYRMLKFYCVWRAKMKRINKYLHRKRKDTPSDAEPIATHVAN